MLTIALGIVVIGVCVALFSLGVLTGREPVAGTCARSWAGSDAPCPLCGAPADGGKPEVSKEYETKCPGERPAQARVE